MSCVAEIEMNGKVDSQSQSHLCAVNGDDDCYTDMCSYCGYQCLELLKNYAAYI